MRDKENTPALSHDLTRLLPEGLYNAWYNIHFPSTRQPSLTIGRARNQGAQTVGELMSCATILGEEE